MPDVTTVVNRALGHFTLEDLVSALIVLAICLLAVKLLLKLLGRLLGVGRGALGVAAYRVHLAHAPHLRADHLAARRPVRRTNIVRCERVTGRAQIFIQERRRL